MLELRGKRRGVWLLIGVLGFAVAISGGCSNGGYRGPTGTVTGMVTLDGKPVPQGCLVSFVSAEGFANTINIELK